MQKLINISGLILFGLAVGCFFFYQEYQEKEPENRKEQIVNDYFSGKIDRIYRDYSNHGVTVLMLKNGKRLEFNMYEYHQFQKGDSIVKRKGEDHVYLYRNGNVKSYEY